MKKSILLLLISVLLFSCASGYKEVSPNTQNYLSTVESSGVLLEYKYDVITKKKYYKKEKKKGVNVAAIKITNNSGRDLLVGESLLLVDSKGVNLQLSSKENTYDALRQQSGFYFLYLLLTPMQVGASTNQYGEVENGAPIGLAIGPGLSLGNFFVARSANKKFKAELMEYDFHGKTIKNGETIYGIIGVSGDSHEKIDIKVLD